MQIKNGDPLVLKDARGFKKHGLYKGMKGYATSVMTLSPTETYVFFMPEGIQEVFVLNPSRLEVDEERLKLEEGDESAD